MFPDGSTELQEGTNCTGTINVWEKGKECFLFEAQTIIMSSELYDIHRSKIIQYLKVWDEVNGLKAL